MRPLNQRGFTLLELLLGLVLLGLLGGILVTAVRGAAGAALRATRLLAADRALTTMQLFLRQELRDAEQGDIAAISATRVSLPRTVGDAAVCQDLGGSVVLADSDWTGIRAPAAGRDAVWLLVDPSTGTWQLLPILAVGAASCPLPRGVAIQLTVAPHAGVAVVARVVEPVELSVYRAGTADWFGLTPASHTSSVQPFAGPLEIGSTVFALYPDRLETAVTPQGSSASVIQSPLRSPP